MPGISVTVTVDSWVHKYFWRALVIEQEPGGERPRREESWTPAGASLEINYKNSKKKKKAREKEREKPGFPPECELRTHFFRV